MIECKDENTYLVTCNHCDYSKEYQLVEGSMELYHAIINDGWQIIERYSHLCKQCQQGGAS